MQYKESGNINDASYWNELQQNLIERTAKWCFATTRHGDLSKLWKEGVSRKHKLIRSVTSRLPEIWDGLQKSLFLQRMEQILADAFSLSKVNYIPCLEWRLAESLFEILHRHMSHQCLQSRESTDLSCCKIKFRMYILPKRHMAWIINNHCFKTLLLACFYYSAKEVQFLLSCVSTCQAL